MDQEDKLLIRALNISYYFLRSRPRTIAEVKERLRLRAKQKPKRYPFDENLIDRAIERLTEEGLVDDKKFVEWFVRYRTIMKAKGTYVLKQELKNLGVSQDVIDEYFDQNPLDEEAAATDLLARRYARMQTVPREKRYKKMTDFLARRGFSYATAKKAIAEVTGEEYNRGRK